MAADILGDKFLANGKIYFSARTKLKITAIDNKVGVQEVKYSIGNSPFELYDQLFYLPNIVGNHNIKFFAVDKLGNQTNNASGSKYDEFKHDVSKVYVGVAGLTINYKIIGDNLLRIDTIIIGPKTPFFINAYDPESGLNKIAYSFDGLVEEVDYTAPIFMPMNGYHTLEMFAYDNISNRSINKFFFILMQFRLIFFINLEAKKLELALV